MDWQLWCGIILGILYVVLCLLALFQVVRIVLNGHRMDSFQFVFLALCFLWTLLRGLFWLLVDQLTWPIWLYTLVYNLPNVCQISTFSLLILYYAKLVHRSRWRNRKSFFITCYVVANTLMIMLTVFISGLTELQARTGSDADSSSSSEPPVPSTAEPSSSTTQLLDTLHYLTSAMYYGCLVVLAAWHVHRLRRMGLFPSTNLREQTQQARNSMQMVLSTSLVFAIFLSRCVYDFLAAFHMVVGSGFHISQAGSNQENNSAVLHIKLVPVTAFILLILWEVLPTSLVLVYFRKIPRNHLGPGAKIHILLQDWCKPCCISSCCCDNEDTSGKSICSSTREDHASLDFSDSEEHDEDNDDDIDDVENGLIYSFRSPSARRSLMENRNSSRVRSDSLTISTPPCVAVSSSKVFSKSSSPNTLEDSDSDNNNNRWNKGPGHHSGSSDIGSGSYSIPNPYLQEINRFNNNKLHK